MKLTVLTTNKAKMKKIISYIVTIFLVIGITTSCSRVEENLFEESAAIRLNKSISDITDLLQSAENGWIMEYFPNGESAGVVFLVNFISSKEAKMASDNQYLKNTYTEANGYWRVISDMGPVLTFDTYNDIFHLFSDPVDPSSGSSDGVGLGGDYEFLIVAISQDLITLKGKKNGTTTLLRRFENGKDWKTYFTELRSMNTALFGTNMVPLRLTVNGNDTLTLKNGGSHIFTTIPKGGTEIDDADELPFIVTDYGIRFVYPFSVNNVSIQDFKLSEDGNELICIDKDANAMIQAVLPNEVFHEMLNKKKYLNMTSSPEMMSASIMEAYQLINSAVVAATRKLDYIGFVNNKDLGLTLAIMSSKGTSKVEGNIGYDLIKKENTVQLVRNGKNDNDNGKNYIKNFAANTLLNTLEGEYILSVSGTKLTSTTIRFENKNDKNKWFVLSMK